MSEVGIYITWGIMSLLLFKEKEVKDCGIRSIVTLALTAIVDLVLSNFDLI